MRNLIRLGALLLAAGALAALPLTATAASAAPTHLAFASAPAGPVRTAAAPAPQPETGTFLFCLFNAVSECWTTHGAGGQMTIQNSGATGFYETAVTSTSGYYKLHVANSQNCVTEESGSAVDVEACASGAENQWWSAAFKGGGPGNGCFFMTFSDPNSRIMTFTSDNGKPIWDNQSSGWSAWATNMFGGCD